MYLGLWEVNAWKATYCSAIGAMIGALVAKSVDYKILQISLIFLVTMYINHTSLLDQFGKVICGLGFIICALTQSQYGYWKTVFGIIVVIVVPFLITGFTLLFPFPMTTHNKCKDMIDIICRKLTKCIELQLCAFGSYDESDIYISQCNHELGHIEILLESLNQLKIYIEYEEILFPSLHGMSKYLGAFVVSGKKIVCEIRSMMEIYPHIIHNYTQSKFVYALKTPFDDTLVEIRECLISISLHFETSYLTVFDLMHNSLISIGRRCYNCIKHPSEVNSNSFLFNANIPLSDNKHFNSLMDKKNIVLEAIRLTREKYIFMTISPRSRQKSYDSHFDISQMHENKNSIDNHGFNNVSEEEFEIANESTVVDLDMVAADVSECCDSFVLDIGEVMEVPHFDTMNEVEAENLIRKRSATIASFDPESDVYDEIIYRENLIIGLHNLSPRFSFFARFLFTIDLISELPQIFIVQKQSESPSLSMTTLCREWLLWALTGWIYWLYQYCVGSVVDIRNAINASFIVMKHFLYTSCCCNKQYSSNDRDYILNRKAYKSAIKTLRLYIHPLKIATATTLCSLLVIVDSLKSKYPFGLWSVIVLMLIRQDNIASSFHTGYQRIEGTVIGSVYSYIMSGFFSCSQDSDHCDLYIQILILGIWLGCCAYFREGPNHGYAAIVAGFTPVVLLLGPTEGSNEGAWGRILMTIIGVSVYLLIDNLFFPIRSDSSLRSNLTENLFVGKSIMEETAISISLLMRDSNVTMNPELSYRVTHMQGHTLTARLPLSSLDNSLSQDEINTLFLNHLESAENKLAMLLVSIKKQNASLILAMREPQLWHRYFISTCRHCICILMYVYY
jgi:hypothetical protein